MTIGNYTELQEAVQNWLDDTSISSRITEFITLGESRINRDLGRLRMAWTNGALTGTPSSRSVALPSTFVEAQTLWLTTSGDQVMLEPFVNGTMNLRTSDGTPKAWSINGSNIDLDCPCDAAHTFLFRYRAKWAIATDVTNWLLTNHPDVYLSATLIDAFRWRRDRESMTEWAITYKGAVEEVEQKEARNLAIAPLRVDAALQVHGMTFNYTTGQ